MSNILKSLKSSIKQSPAYTSYRAWRAKIKERRESNLSDTQYFSRRHKHIFGYTPHFKKPQTFNEKIIHRVLYDRRPIYTALADKLKARIYVASMLQDFYTPNDVAFNGGGGSRF